MPSGTITVDDEADGCGGFWGGPARGQKRKSNDAMDDGDHPGQWSRQLRRTMAFS